LSVANARPGYKKTKEGVIPADWEVVPLGRIAKFSSGALINVASLHEQSSDYPVPVFGGNGISGYTRDALMSGPTIIVGRVGQKCGMVHFSEGPAWITDNALYPVHFQREAHPQFLALALQHVRLNDVRNRNDLPLVTQSILDAVRIAWPPEISEQRAIAAALGDVDSLIRSLDQLIAKKRDLKQAAMQQLLTGKQRLPGFDGEWREGQLGDVIEKLVGGGTPSRSNPAYWGNEIQWATVKDIATFNPHWTQEAITRQGLKNSSSNLIPAGTLITSTRMALGKAIIYEVDVAINQDLKALFPKQNVSVKYLYYWLEHNTRMIGELGNGSTVKGISISDLKGIPFLLAPIPEQSAIATVLSDMDAEITALEQRRDKTRALKQGMMQELLTGRIRLI